jgi:hypothetical protein
MTKALLLAAAAALLLATPAAAAHRVCLRHGEVDNWKSIDAKTIVLEDRGHKKILAKLIGTCSNLNFDLGIEIRSPGATYLSCIEPGDIVVTRDNGAGGRCSIVSVEPYTGSMKAHDAGDHGGDHHDHDSY